ncbi:MAG: tol-pal system protein YbgF [Xanthobacteraceae bacterium]
MNRLAVRAGFTFAVIATTWIAFPTQAQEGEGSFNLFDRIFGGSERIAGERNAQVAPNERTAQPGSPDVVLRLERLESQIRQLTGVIEQLQYRNQQLEAQLQRLQESGGAPPRPGAQIRPQPLPGQATQGTAGARRGDAFDPTQYPNAPGAPNSLGAMGAIPAEPGGAARVPADPLARSASTTVIPGTLPPSQTAKDEFDLAYGYVLRRDFPLAEESLRSFLSKYPNDRFTGDATFWLGESLYQRQRFRDAAEQFLNVSTKFDSNPKAPDALLRLGQSLAALGEKEAACASLGEVARKFPRASAAVKQGVDREQKRVHC